MLKIPEIKTDYADDGRHLGAKVSFSKSSLKPPSRSTSHHGTHNVLPRESRKLLNVEKSTEHLIRRMEELAHEPVDIS